jgi:hypothetical protein
MGKTARRRLAVEGRLRPAARRRLHVAAEAEGDHPRPANDENLAVAQTHLAMIRFHNRVVDTLGRGPPAALRAARER